MDNILDHFKPQISKIKQNLQLQFKNKKLLMQVFTHSSYANQIKNPQIQDNERLEFFGDAVLKLIVTEYLIKKYPDLPEGDLTKIRASIISDKNLAKLAQEINLGDYLLLSHSEQKTGGRQKSSNLANTMEALLGAYYLDQGLTKVKNFFFTILEQYQTISPHPISDARSTLQELLQKHNLPMPTYTVLKEDGPEHQKTFYIKASASFKNQTITATGSELNKKEAARMAAQKILQIIQETHLI